MASVIARKLGVGGRLLAAADSIIVKVSGIASTASKLADVLLDLHANDLANRAVVNKLRADLVDARTVAATVRTLANEVKADYNALRLDVGMMRTALSAHTHGGVTVGAGTTSAIAALDALTSTGVVATDVAALAVATATADLAALSTSVEDAS